MPEEGSAGLALVKQKCTVCHGLPHPKRHTANEWDHLLALMTERMKEKQVPYTSGEMQQIQSYLHRNAR
jgi:cytochrome c5